MDDPLDGDELAAAIGAGQRFVFGTPQFDPHRVVIGIPPGRTRPALWLEHPIKGPSKMLALFHGPDQAAALVLYLNSAHDEINRAIDHHARPSPGDSHGK